jgi:WD40 repeat protein
VNGKLLKSHNVVPEQQNETLANPPHLLCVSVDPRNRIGAVACGDGRILLWDCVKRKMLPPIKGFHSYSASHVVKKSSKACLVSLFLMFFFKSWPSADLLLSCGNDMKAAIWQIDVRKPKSSNLKSPKASFELKGKPNWACSSRTDAFFAIADTILQLSLI